MVIAFAKYLGFWNLNLKEMYRFYLLFGKGHLVHVSFPSHLKTDLNSDHPGYFWSNVNCFDLFEVKTVDEKYITDQTQKEEFLSQHFNRFMVELAVENYDNFCTCLEGNKYNSFKKHHQCLLEEHKYK
jgi:hypothetical protein